MNTVVLLELVHNQYQSTVDTDDGISRMIKYRLPMTDISALQTIGKGSYASFPGKWEVTLIPGDFRFEDKTLAGAITLAVAFCFSRKNPEPDYWC